MMTKSAIATLASANAKVKFTACHVHILEQALLTLPYVVYGPVASMNA